MFLLFHRKYDLHCANTEHSGLMCECAIQYPLYQWVRAKCSCVIPGDARKIRIEKESMKR